MFHAIPSSKPKSSTTLSLYQSALPWPEALLRLACASHEHTRHPNPKLPQLKQPSTAAMFHRFSEETCSIIFLFKRDTELAQFHSNLINLGYVTTSKIKSPTYTIYMTSGPMKIHGSNLDCFKLQASSFQWFKTLWDFDEARKESCSTSKLDVYHSYSLYWNQNKHQPDLHPLHHRCIFLKEINTLELHISTSAESSFEFLNKSIGISLALDSA